MGRRGWIASERLTRARPPASTLEGLADTFSLQPMLPPGFERLVAVAGDRVDVELRATTPGLLDVEHPGWCGLLARGDRRGIEAMAHGVDRRAQLGELHVDGDRVRFGVTVDEEAAPAAEPDAVALVRIGMVSVWNFDTTDRVATSR